jgi:hypothetical protein
VADRADASAPRPGIGGTRGDVERRAPRWGGRGVVRRADGVGRAPESDERDEAQRPPELVEHHRLEERAGAQEERRRGDGAGGEELRPASSAEVAREHRGEQHEHGSGEGRRQTQHGHRLDHPLVAGDGARELGEHGDERREVHRPEPQVLAHGEVEQLVAVDAVG